VVGVLGEVGLGGVGGGRVVVGEVV
jgi:hypothetical protein